MKSADWIPPGGIPRKVLVTSEEVREALYEPLEEIVDCIRRTIERCQPELIADLADTGLILAGGGSRCCEALIVTCLSIWASPFAWRIRPEPR